MAANTGISWNNEVRLVFADVDETIAEVYTPADPAMITELSRFLIDGGRLFMVTGGSLKRVLEGITNKITPKLRHQILISHCSGAEVWGFTPDGELRDQPFYSIYKENFTEDMKRRWRQAVDQLITEFNLRLHPVQPKATFWNEIGRDPHDIMYDDRGPQITLEVVNGHDLTDTQLGFFTCDVPFTYDQRRDLRIPLMRRAEEIFTEMNVPVTPRLGGVFALDLAIEGCSKTTSIKYVLENPHILEMIGLSIQDLAAPASMEVWGDKYSILHGGTDRHMSEALPPSVRSIDFRQENPKEFPEGYNIVLWDGIEHLHSGLLEYLQSRPQESFSSGLG
jgi:hydroxymethylpyrimidine pyrophosphatase-like HAD family hydrolase